MTKKSTITKILAGAMAMALSTSLTSFAQTSGGPDTFGYTWRDNNDANGPTYNWIDITSAPGAVQVSGLADDNLKGPYAVGFPFHYYWYDVTTFYVGSNGYMGFSTTPVAHPFPVIPLPTQIQNYLAVMTSDLTFTDPGGSPIPGAEAWYWTNTAADTLILSYNNVPFWDPNSPGYTGANSFQIILSGADSSITFQYLLQSGVYNNPTDFCTIGIENNSGNIGLMHTHDILPPSQYAIKFYYPPTTSFIVNDASTIYNNNETSGGLFLSKNGGQFTMNTQIKNVGNQTLAPFNVFSRVVNGLNVSQASSTVQSNSLAPGQTEDITFPVTYSPTTAGTFRYINDTQLSGDATPSNNQKVMELQVVDTTQTSMLLSFDNNLDAGLGGLGWQGGGGGAGIQFIPPFYPCIITQLRAFIAANANNVGFALMVLDDDGPNGSPLTVLDSVWVDPASILINDWNYVTLTAPLTVASGGFYVAWVMGGDGISIGQNQLAPFSNRTFEILGQASNPNAWADYRYREIEDIMLNAYISTVPTGLNENNASNYISNCYPNPASNSVNIDYSLPGELTYSVLDLNGRELLNGVGSKSLNRGSILINTESLSAGIYVVKLNSGDQSFVKKMNIIR